MFSILFGIALFLLCMALCVVTYFLRGVALRDTLHAMYEPRHAEPTYDAPVWDWERDGL